METKIDKNLNKEEVGTFFVMYDTDDKQAIQFNLEDSNLVEINSSEVQNFLVKNISEDELGNLLENLLETRKINCYCYHKVQANML
jgi:hypothetical protein